MTEVKEDFNPNNFKCRCSAITRMMAGSKDNPTLTENQEKELAELREKQQSAKGITANQKARIAELEVKEANKGKVILSTGAIEYLMEWYAWETEQMISVNKETMEILSISKGRKQEKQAAVLLGFVDDAVYKEHKERISNDYLSGEIDLYLGESVYEANRVADIKNAWDYPGFLKKINNGLENGQRDQVAGYGTILNCTDLVIANCLVDCTDENIEEVKWRVAKKLGAITTESPEFLQEWAKWEKSMRFEHIDPYKRVFKIQIDPFSESEKQKIYDKVKICREWLFDFDNRYRKFNRS